MKTELANYLNTETEKLKAAQRAEKVGPPITQLEFEEEDFDVAERVAKQLGYTQTAYTSSSAMWGLFCLPDRATQKSGCVIKTKELGFLFIQNLENLRIEE